MNSKEDASPDASKSLPAPPVALCLSGHGPEAAGAAIGIMQGMAVQDRLGGLARICGVGTGAHVAGWWHAWSHLTGTDRAPAELAGSVPQPNHVLQPETASLRQLRTGQRLLDPRQWSVGDWWRLVVPVLHNATFELIWLSLAAATLLLLPWTMLAVVESLSLRTILPAGLSVAAALFISALLAWTTSSGLLASDRPEYWVHVLRGVLRTTGVALWLAVWVWAVVLPDTLFPSALTGYTGFAVVGVGAAMLLLIQGLVALRQTRKPKRHDLWRSVSTELSWGLAPALLCATALQLPINWDTWLHGLSIDPDKLLKPLLTSGSLSALALLILWAAVRKQAHSLRHSSFEWMNRIGWGAREVLLMAILATGVACVNHIVIDVMWLAERDIVRFKLSDFSQSQLAENIAELQNLKRKYKHTAEQHQEILTVPAPSISASSNEPSQTQTKISIYQWDDKSKPAWRIPNSPTASLAITTNRSASQPEIESRVKHCLLIGLVKPHCDEILEIVDDLNLFHKPNDIQKGPRPPAQVEHDTTAGRRAGLLAAFLILTLIARMIANSRRQQLGNSLQALAQQRIAQAYLPPENNQASIQLLGETPAEIFGQRTELQLVASALTDTLANGPVSGKARLMPFILSTETCGNTDVGLIKTRELLEPFGLRLADAMALAGQTLLPDWAARSPVGPGAIHNWTPTALCLHLLRLDVLTPLAWKSAARGRVMLLDGQHADPLALTPALDARQKRLIVVARRASHAELARDLAHSRLSARCQSGIEIEPLETDFDELPTGQDCPCWLRFRVHYPATPTHAAAAGEMLVFTLPEARAVDTQTTAIDSFERARRTGLSLWLRPPGEHKAATWATWLDGLCSLEAIQPAPRRVGALTVTNQPSANNLPIGNFRPDEPSPTLSSMPAWALVASTALASTAVMQIPTFVPGQATAPPRESSVNTRAMVDALTAANAALEGSIRATNELTTASGDAANLLTGAASSVNAAASAINMAADPLKRTSDNIDKLTTAMDAVTGAARNIASSSTQFAKHVADATRDNTATAKHLSEAAKTVDKAASSNQEATRHAANAATAAQEAASAALATTNEVATGIQTVDDHLELTHQDRSILTHPARLPEGAWFR